MAKNVTKGGIDKWLQEAVRRDSNCLSIIKLYAELLFTSNERVSIEYTEEDGTKRSFDVPSMAYLTAAINRLDRNFENLSSVGILDAQLILPNGERRTIIAQSYRQEPPITNITLKTPKFFQYTNNDVFNKFVSPQTYMSFGVTTDLTVRSARITKVSLSKLNSDERRQEFLRNTVRQEFSYADVENLLRQQDITYDVTTDTVEVSPQRLQFKGTFDVLNYQRQEDKIYYYLNTVEYLDLSNGSAVTLKVGDRLAVRNADGDSSTIYEIVEVNIGERRVLLSLHEGLQPVRVGADSLFLVSPKQKEVYVNVPITKGETFFPFIQLVDDRNVIQTTYGTSCIVDVDSLQDVDTQKTFVDFFNQSVTDYRTAIETVRRLNPVSLEDAEKPQAPVLLEQNFSVNIANRHKLDEIEQLTQDKYAEKEKLKTQIATVDTEIQTLKQELLFERSSTKIEKLKKQIEQQYKTRDQYVAQFETTITDIVDTVSSIGEFTPKYRLQGFFDVPPTLKDQNIVRFEVEYRYLRRDDSKSSDQTTTYTDANGNTVNATYSSWNRLLSMQTRAKVYDTVLNRYEWEENNELSPDSISFNEVSIPISENESVEVRVRSVSEVGFPLYAIRSDWSQSIVVAFPDNYAKSTSSIFKELSVDRFNTTLYRELNNIGLYEHLEDGIKNNDQTFRHSAEMIYTTSFTPENKRKSVQQIIDELQRKIDEMSSNFLTTTPEIVVELQDADGNVISKIQDNDLIRVHTGYYKDKVKNLQVPKGEIITDVYYVVIRSKSSTSIPELLSYVPGDGNLPHEAPTGYYYSNKDEYEQWRKYYTAPVIFQNLSYPSYEKRESGGYKLGCGKILIGNRQTRSQLVYLRGRDKELQEELFVNPQDITTGSYNGYVIPDVLGATGLSTPEFVVDLYTKPSGLPYFKNKGKYDGRFGVHVSHPMTNSLDTAQAVVNETPNFRIMTTDYSVDGQWTYDGTPNNLCYILPTKLSNSKGYIFPIFAFPDLMSDTSSIKQLGLRGSKFPTYSTFSGNTLLLPSPAVNTVADYFKYMPFTKVGFCEYDKYTLGHKTCGMFVGLYPMDERVLTMKNASNRRGLRLDNEVKIPIYVQSRLTDFHGNGTDGTGYIGGSQILTNIKYEKKIGLDLLLKYYDDVYSFDISFVTEYQR
jgi:hypothetical protein